MSDKSLLHIYNEVAEKASNVYVVPLIRYEYPSTDYLYLLYKDILESPAIKIISLSALAHLRLIFAPISDKNVILHYHWLEFQDLKSAIGIIYKLICISLFKLFGGKLIWTVHNLYPHNKKWITLHKKIYIWMASKADRLIVHSPSAINIVANEYELSHDKIEVFPHPVFPSFKKEKVEAIKSINEHFGFTLNHKVPVFGCFGAISEYKQLPELIDLVSRATTPKQLLIAGYVKKDMHEIDQQIRDKAKSYGWLFYHNGFIEENILPDLMSAFDICVFNFRDILTSGGIEMALAYDKIIVAPELPSLKEYETNEMVHLFRSAEHCIEILNRLTAVVSG